MRIFRVSIACITCGSCNYKLMQHSPISLSFECWKCGQDLQVLRLDQEYQISVEEKKGSD